VKTKRTIVILEVMQDYDERDPQPWWWDALGLSPPWRWHEETEERNAAAKVLVEREVV
jgi:hypothetical protein